MITLPVLAALAEEYAEQLAAPVEPLVIGDRTFDTDAEPVIMGTVNLSRDSTYRESIATGPESAIRKARIQVAQGAHCVDIGTESTNATAARVEIDDQIARLVPVVEGLAAEGVPVSVEGYDAAVVEAGLQAGARLVNLTGSADDEAVFGLAASHDATVIICWSAADNVREVTDVPTDPFPELLEHFEKRVQVARDLGVRRLAIDPGLGFYYGNLVDPRTRMRYQTDVLLRTFRLRTLGLPVCHALPHAFDLFEDEFRSAEGFFAVLARLGGTGIVRTHEVARVRAVLEGMRVLG
jgi:dihydropteroate synthase